MSVARNLGARKASGDVFVYTDDDCVADEHWISHLIAAFDRDGIEQAILLLELKLRRPPFASGLCRYRLQRELQTPTALVFGEALDPDCGSELNQEIDMVFLSLVVHVPNEGRRVQDDGHQGHEQKKQGSQGSHGYHSLLRTLCSGPGLNSWMLLSVLSE